MNEQSSMILMPLYGEIDNDGRVQRIAASVSELANVTIFCIDSKRPFSHSQFTVHRVNIPPVRIPALRYFLFCLKFLWFAIRFRPSIIFAHDFFLPFPGWLAARLVGAKVIYDAHELIIPTPGVPLNSYNRFFYSLEKIVIHKLDLVIAANSERARLMQEHYGLLQQPLTIQNIPPKTDQLPEPSAIQSRFPIFQAAPPDTVWCVYQGYIAAERGLEWFVDAINELEPHYRLLVVGDGERPFFEKLQQHAVQLGCNERVVFLGKVAKEDIQPILGQCHVGLLSYREDILNIAYCAPNKIYEYAQAGLPSVNIGSAYLCDLVDTTEIGMSLRTHDANGISVAAAIRTAFERRKQYQDRCVQFLEQNKWEQESEKLQQNVMQLCEGDFSNLAA